MRYTVARRIRAEHGAAAVEFGLIAVILLTIILAIMQFAIWLWAYQVGAHAAREGARLAAVDPCNTAAIETRAEDRALSATDGTPDANVTPPTNYKVGEEITVAVEFDTYQITTGLLPFSLPTIYKAATTRIENVPAGCGTP